MSCAAMLILTNVQLNWEEPSKVMKVSIDQAKARLLGVSSVGIANILNGAMSELYISEFREGIERIDLIAVLTLLILQLQSFSRVFLVMLSAPLGIIGVTIASLVFDKLFGFVAMLGTIALSGMIMHNSVILGDQFEQDRATGIAPWQAVVESTIRVFRPIVLTAAAAILAMIPLTRSVFFCSMAVAIMGGLAVATL